MFSSNIRYSRSDHPSLKDIIDYQVNDGIKIAIGNVYYQCKDELKRMLYSTVSDYPTVQVIILIEGVYEYLANKLSPVSTDGTNEMIDTFVKEQKESGSKGIKVYNECLVGTEFEKRQRYLELCQIFKCNVLMIVDSDEYFIEDERIQVTQNWKDFRRRLKGAFTHDHNVYDMNIIETEFGGRHPHKRIWIHPEQMTYWKGSHFKYHRAKDPNKEQSEWAKRHNSQQSWYTFEEVTLKHDHNLRTIEHLQHRKLYENYLVVYEMLLESGYSEFDADMFAKAKMQIKMGYQSKCTCRRCVEVNRIDPRILFDQRPKDKRGYDPFADIKARIKNDPQFAKTLKANFE